MLSGRYWLLQIEPVLFFAHQFDTSKAWPELFPVQPQLVIVQFLFHLMWQHIFVSENTSDIENLIKCFSSLILWILL